MLRAIASICELTFFFVLGAISRFLFLQQARDFGMSPKLSRFRAQLAALVCWFIGLKLALVLLLSELGISSIWLDAVAFALSFYVAFLRPWMKNRPPRPRWQCLPPESEAPATSALRLEPRHGSLRQRCLALRNGQEASHDKTAKELARVHVRDRPRVRVRR